MIDAAFAPHRPSITSFLATRAQLAANAAVQPPVMPMALAVGDFCFLTVEWESSEVNSGTTYPFCLVQFARSAVVGADTKLSETPVQLKWWRLEDALEAGPDWWTRKWVPWLEKWSGRSARKQWDSDEPRAIIKMPGASLWPSSNLSSWARLAATSNNACALISPPASAPDGQKPAAALRFRAALGRCAFTPILPGPF